LTNNDLQSTTQKTKDPAKQTSLKSGGELWCSEKVSSSCSTCDTRSITVKRTRITWHGSRVWRPVYV